MYNPFATGLTLVLPTVLFSSTAQAHVKWFIDPQNIQHTQYAVYKLFDLPVIIWLLIAFGLITAAIYLDKKLPTPVIVRSSIRHKLIDLLSFCCGISLLVSAIDGVLIAPHYLAYNSFTHWLLYLQGLIALLLIVNRWVLQAASLLVVLYIGVVFQFGMSEALEYANVIGIALFLIFNNCASLGFSNQLKPYSVGALRIFTGIALMTLGVTEKLLGVEYGQAFIATYDWNFMAKLGFSAFSDQLFVLSAGVMEVVFGAILVLGVLTRLNTLVIASFMLASNITFVFQSNQSAAIMELFGHLPIIASAVILIFLGAGQRLLITNAIGRRSVASTSQTAVKLSEG